MQAARYNSNNMSSDATFRKALINSAAKYAKTHHGMAEHERGSEVVVTGILLNAENARPQPFGAGKVMRKFCVLLDNKTKEHLLERWGPGVPIGQHPKPNVLHFTEEEDPDPFLVGMFSKNSRTEIAKHLTSQGLNPASFGIGPATCSIVCGNMCKFECEAKYYDELDVSKVAPGDIVKVIGVKYYCGYRFEEVPKKRGRPQHQRYVNLNARAIVKIARLAPSDLMCWYAKQGLTTSFLPKYESSLVQVDYSGPYFTINVHFNNSNAKKGSIEDVWRPLLSGTENGLLITNRAVNDNDYNSIFLKTVSEERRDNLLWSILTPQRGVEQLTRNMLTLLGCDMIHSGDDMKTLSTHDAPADSLSLALFGQFSKKVPDPNDETKILATDTITFSQPGMKGSIYLPLDPSLHTKIVKPMGVVNFRLFPSELAPLGIVSLRVWQGLTGYIPTMEFILSGPVIGDSSDSLEVNQGGCVIPSDESILNPKVEEEYISWDEPSSTMDEGAMEEESDLSHAEGGVKKSFPTVCGFSMTVKQFIIDGRAFYSRGAKCTKEMALKIFLLKNEELQRIVNDRAKLLAVKPQRKPGQEVDRLAAAKQASPEKRMEEQAKNMAFYHTDYVQTRILKTHNLAVLNEGCLCDTVSDEKTPKISDVQLLLTDDRAFRRVKTLVFLPILPAGVIADESFFAKLQALSPQQGDELCAFLDPNTFETDRPSLRAKWESENQIELIDVVEHFGDYESWPVETPITAIVCHPNANWKSKEVAESVYGSFTDRNADFKTPKRKQTDAPSGKNKRPKGSAPSGKSKRSKSSSSKKQRKGRAPEN